MASLLSILPPLSPPILPWSPSILSPDMADWLGMAEGDIIASELIMAEEEGADDAEELDDALGDEF